jgi:aryl-alcohol dehydrogenase-like predicted oxidoreductase
MNNYKLGNSELEVSRLGMGCMGMSEFYGSSNERESIKTLHQSVELGVNFFDTADVYGQGRNELLLSKAFNDRRKQVIIATKFGILRDSSGNFSGICGRPEYVKESCEKSLQRLGTDVIDLYYAHRIDPEVPIEDTVGAMKALVDQGKVRFIGLSEASPEIIRRAQEVYPIAALQSEYSLWCRDLEDEVLATCRELGIALVTYSPLGRGFLTGKIPNRDVLEDGDWRLDNPRFQKEAIEKNKIFIDLINETAQSKKITPAQVALAWLLHQGKDVFPIPGTRNISRLKENLSSLEVQFSKEELSTITDKLPSSTFGERY